MRFDASEISRVKSQAKLSDTIGQHVVWDKKKTKARAGDYWACCPFHGERSPSFHVSDKKGFYFCFACGVKGDAIKFLTDFVGISFVDAVARLGGQGSVAEVASPRRDVGEERRREMQAAEKSEAEQREQRVRKARAFFKAGVPIAGTIAETYLLSRGIPIQPWPADRLRFIGELELEIDRKGRHPALVAAVTDVSDQVTAIWQIYLSGDGRPLVGESGKKLKVGRGPASGGAVRLGPAGRTIAVTEGLETAFAVKALTKSKYSVWAALSTSGMIGLEVPPEVREVRIYADGDSSRFNPVSGALSVGPGLQAAMRLRDRLIERKIDVVIEEPVGGDWLDVWESVAANERT